MSDAAPAPCLEIVRLPSDGLFDYSTECEIISLVDRSSVVGYTQFPYSLRITFAVKGQLELGEIFPVINPEYKNRLYYTPMFNTYRIKLKLNKKYSLQSPTIITNIKNTYPWSGIGHWIRLIEVPACDKESFSLQTLKPLQIMGGCGELEITSVIGKADIEIHKSVFKLNLYYQTYYQFLNVAIFLPTAEEVSNSTTGRAFNAELQWSSADGLQKRIVYTNRQYLEINIFSQSSQQNFSIDLEWYNMLDHIQFAYIRRSRVIDAKAPEITEHAFYPSWIGVKNPEVCLRRTSSCYRYQESGDLSSEVTWKMAQSRCAEQNSNLVSINSPVEWHSLLVWAYNLHTTTSGLWAFIADIEAFKGRLLFIGQRRTDVSKLVEVLFYFGELRNA